MLLFSEDTKEVVRNLVLIFGVVWHFDTQTAISGCPLMALENKVSSLLHTKEKQQ